MDRAISQQQRRIEILGMVAMNPVSLTIGDIANLFSIDEEMVKKDLKALRSEGIAIHQIRKQGLSITMKINPMLLQEYLHQYFLLSRGDVNSNRMLEGMVKINGEFTIGLIVILQRAIREHYTVQIQYLNIKGDEPRTHDLHPIKLFSREGLLRLLALANDKFLQFHVARIVSITLTGRSFVPPPQHIIDEQFKYSWNTWTGDDKMKIQLRMTKFWADRLAICPAVDGQRITRSGDYYRYDATVNSLDELARWIVARRGEVVAIAPKKLRDDVIAVAKECLRVHRA